jgi:UDP-N-acetylmuramoyl-tripeptide--D-alanyl-D-alanine ligase
MGNAITSTIIDQKQNLWNVKLKTAGKHYMKNAAALLALVFSLKLNPSKAILALERWSPLPGRGQVLEIEVKHSNYETAIYLIDESYNANPGSVKSSLETLASIYSNKRSKCKYSRRIAVLGDMLELGSSEVEEHVNISRFARLDKIDKIYCVGSRMKKLFDVLPSSKRGYWTETAEEMQNVLVNKLENGDIIMIKGSFSMGMKAIVTKLKNI